MPPPRAGAARERRRADPRRPRVITPAIRRAILDGRFEAEEASQIAAIVRPGDRRARDRRRHRLHLDAARPAAAGLPHHRGRGQPPPDGLHGPAARPQPGAQGPPDQCRPDRRPGAEPHLLPAPRFLDGVAGAAAEPLCRHRRGADAGPFPLLRDEGIDLVVCDVEGAEATLFEGADLAGVDRIWVETHDHVTGLSGVRRLFATMADQGFVYDPRHSHGQRGPVPPARRDRHRAACTPASRSRSSTMLASRDGRAYIAGQQRRIGRKDDPPPELATGRWPVSSFWSPAWPT